MNQLHSGSSSHTPHSAGARIWMAMLGGSFTLMGAAAAVYLCLSFLKARQYDHWAEEKATVIVSTIDDSDRSQHNQIKYRLEVHYRYQFQGESYISSRVKRLPVASKSHKKIEQWQERYPVGQNVSCFIDPDNPSQALLEKPTKAAIYSLWFPGFIMLFGFRLIFIAVSGKSVGKNT